MLKYRLQFFAEDGSGGEKTEDATTKKLQDARKEGQVARSQELISAAALLVFFVTLKIFVGTIGNGMIDSFKSLYSQIEIIANKGEEFSIAIVSAVMDEVIMDIIVILIPIMVTAVVTAFAINVFQVRWQITGKPLTPKLSKFNPIKGFKKIFSKDKIVELIKSILKVFIIGIIAYSTLKDQLTLIFSLTELELTAALELMGDIILNLGLKISAFYFVIGIGDFIYQKIKFKNEMKMTKQEVKDEFKQTEGDPQTKSRIRQKMRDASRRRMMQKIPEADVVITNPTHFACALKYDKLQAAAPVLVAKGADYLAEKIKEAARDNNVPIVENRPLARMLYYNVDLDAEIPQELYKMAAEVLAYVYSLKNK